MRTVVLCPFAAGTVLWQAQSGSWTLSVCVRGTFSLVHGREVVLADAQEPVTGDRWAGDDPRLGLRVPSDRVPYKPRIDVVLVGSAFAPHQEPVEALVARLSMGGLDKAIGVIGDRVWIEGPDGPEPSAAHPFRTMPLGYERAARARDNPHGFDLTRPPALGALALPNLEAADDEIGGDRTVGFGPVAPGASARRGLLRPDGWAWAEAAASVDAVEAADAGGVAARGPAPAGFDFAFYNAAPRDQQIDRIDGGDPLLLVNLNREHPRLETRLPDVRAKAFLVSADMAHGAEIALRCDTIWIDTDRALVALSWRGTLAVTPPDEEALGTLVVAAEPKGSEIGYAQIEKLLRDGTNTVSTDNDTFTIPGGAAPRRESQARADPDDVPTPGPIRPKRALPAVDDEAPPAPSPSARVPVMAPSRAPVLIQAADADEPGASTWEELTGSDLMEMGSPDEPKTLTRIEARRRLDDGLGDEPSTRPLLVRPATPATFGPPDYARIAVAAERGQAASALFLYGLAVPDLPRLQAEWRERSAADPGFAEAFARAVAEARRT